MVELSEKERLYLRSLREWNRIHKIIGQRSDEELYEESRSAIRSLLNSSTDAPGNVCMVDIGAGNGLLGVAWLMADSKHRVIFTEPDPKKAAFLLKLMVLDFKESHRAKILASTIEGVSRETFDQFAGAGTYFFAARAFSGSKGLESALREGGHLPAPVWVFSGAAPSSGENNEKFCLRRLLFS